MENIDQRILHSNIINTSILGIIWGFLELIENKFLMSNNIFTKGLIISLVTFFILIFSKKIIVYKGSLLIMAAIALMIIFAARGYFFSIMLAVFAQAFIAEIIFSFFKFRLASTIIVSTLIFLYTFIHGLVCQGSLLGSYVVYQYQHLFSTLTGISISKEKYLIVLLFFGFITLIVGVAVGWLGFILVKEFDKNKVKGKFKKFVY